MEDSIKAEASGFLKFTLDDASEFLKIEVLLTDIFKSPQTGHEVVAVWQSDTALSNSFFTDSSGLEFVERVQKQGVKNQNVPASTYPVNTAVGIISSEGTAMVVLNDRP